MVLYSGGFCGTTHVGDVVIVILVIIYQSKNKLVSWYIVFTNCNVVLVSWSHDGGLYLSQF